ncbi:PVC-type heme-binding CxxCH protein [Chryseolinea sp. T2]|uniref:PVC-type heme-binding CxxCH protein n=1 Tax=Chryseolinea sp. T2 TaxID=3129255 RepID=UPI003077DCE6
MMKVHFRARRTPSPLVFFCSLYILIAAVACDERRQSGEHSPLDSALTSFELPEGFKIELLASEPLLGDPVDMEIDEDGRLYVVEMPGYPLDKSGTGTVKLLLDKDGDGRMDSSVVFADNLVLPNSVMRWKEGVLVTDAPYVLYFEDTNGDGKAEVRDTVLTGFALSNPQHNLNSPLLGIDNWIYLAHEGAVSTDTYQKEFGDPGAEVLFPQHKSSPRLGVNANGRSVRFKPDEMKLEETSGHTQFGHTFDKWGRHFLVGNANHIYYEAVAASYLQRNKNLLVSDATESISDHGEAAEVFPITQNPQHQLLTDVGVITSACGLTTYLGGAFPSPYDESVTFVAEPVSNLVHVDKIASKGSSFVASRIIEHGEFLASRDAKFRPVNLYIGPDGALYVVDYYRQIIEHPEWMGEEVIKSGKLYNDSNRGRIYRITSDGMEPPAWTKGVHMNDMTSDALVKKLSDKNIWWRMNAQRLLIDRRDSLVIPELQRGATSASSSAGRVHALWTLDALKSLSPATIASALKDSEAGVRENAIRLAELRLSKEKELLTPLFSLASDPDARVRYQLLCAVGSVNSEEAEQVRRQILFKDLKDPWIQVAALSSPDVTTGGLFDEVVRRASDHPDDYRLLIERLSAMIATSNHLKERELLALATQVPQTTVTNHDLVQAAILKGMARGRSAKKQSASPPDQTALTRVIFNHPSTDVGNAALRLLRTTQLQRDAALEDAVRKASSLAVDNSQPDLRRALAIDFLGLLKSAKQQNVFLDLLAPGQPMPVQLAALRSLSDIPGTTVSKAIISRWSTLTPEVHDAAVGTFLEDDDRIDLLLGALEGNKIPASAVAWPRRVGLMAQSNVPLRDRARKLFTANDEAEVRSSLSDVLTLKGDAQHGKEVYQQNCALCHQVRGQMGVSVGPDLGTVHNWSAEAILSNIIKPSQSISSGFDLCSVELHDGTSVQGIVASESPGAITLKNIGSADRTINRSDIKSLKSLNMSVMPTDFATKIDHKQMADLLAFLKQNH